VNTCDRCDWANRHKRALRHYDETPGRRTRLVASPIFWQLAIAVAVPWIAFLSVLYVIIKAL
jgi:hypothetical protein